MIRAYDKVYLDKARTVLARMLDFAVWELGYGIDEFFAMFIKTGLAKRFAEGEFTLLVGMSGVELAYKVLEIDPSASDDEVKKAYKKMAIKHHPDKVESLGDDVKKAAEEKFKSIVAAYEAIKKERGFN